MFVLRSTEVIDISTYVAVANSSENASKDLPVQESLTTSPEPMVMVLSSSVKVPEGLRGSSLVSVMIGGQSGHCEVRSSSIVQSAFGA